MIEKNCFIDLETTGTDPGIHAIHQLAGILLRNERNDPKLPDFKLLTVCKYLGIPVDETKLHDALYDIELTRELFLELTLRSGE